VGFWQTDGKLILTVNTLVGIMLKLFQVIALFFVTMNCYAFHCIVGSTGQTIAPYGGSADVSVMVSPAILGSKTKVYDMNDITCYSDSIGYTDYLYLQSITTALDPTSDLSTVDITPVSGAKITSGIPYSGNAEVIYLPKPKKANGKINVQLYMNVVDNPSNPVIIQQGQLLYKLTFNQTNQDDESNIYTWNLIAANTIHFITTTCTINNGEVLSVDFGTVNSTEIGTSLASTKTITKNFPIHCDDGQSEPMGIALAGTSTTGFDDQNSLVTSDPNLGVVVSKSGQEIGNHEHYVDYLDNGDGNSSLDFSLVKKSSASQLAGGAFSASAVLVVVEP
jgi:hypothetical protein